jgi:hypothetical protein
MLKPLTMSLSLAVALGLCGVSKAGHNNLASPQCGAVASSQCATASPQCGDPCCPPKKKCSLFQHKPKSYCYEWVLKKKKCGGMFGHKNNCDVCGSAVYATGQTMASGQAWGSGQAYGTGQVYGAGQAPATAAVGDEAPPAPPATDAAAPPPPAPPTAPPPGTAGGSLLFLAPTGN